LALLRYGLYARHSPGLRVNYTNVEKTLFPIFLSGKTPSVINYGGFFIPQLGKNVEFAVGKLQAIWQSQIAALEGG
jgi:hypothetical protein